MPVFRVAVQPGEQRNNFFLRVGGCTSGLVTNTNEERNVQGFKLISAWDRSFTIGEDDLVRVAVVCKPLQLQDLRAPALTEKSAGPGVIRFRFRCVDKELLTLKVRVHQVHDGNREAAVPTTQADSNLIGIRETEIAVDVVHHVEKDGIRRVAAVH